MLEQGNADYIDNTRMINVDKLRRFTQIIKSVRMYQLSRYTFEVVEPVREYLLNLRTLVIPEDEMWHLRY